MCSIIFSSGDVALLCSEWITLLDNNNKLHTGFQTFAVCQQIILWPPSHSSQADRSLLTPFSRFHLLLLSSTYQPLITPLMRSSYPLPTPSLTHCFFTLLSPAHLLLINSMLFSFFHSHTLLHFDVFRIDNHPCSSLVASSKVVVLNLTILSPLFLVPSNVSSWVTNHMFPPESPHLCLLLGFYLYVFFWIITLMSSFGLLLLLLLGLYFYIPSRIS